MTEPKTSAMFGSKPGNGRVLLIEDDPGICKEMRTTLETAGRRSLTCSSTSRMLRWWASPTKIPTAMGLRFAREFETPVVSEPMNLIRNENVDLLIDVIGAPAVEALIAEHKHDRVQVLGGAASKLLWLLIQRERDRQSHVLWSEKLAGMIRDGVKDFLVKPVGKDRLIKTVSSAVAQHELSRL